MLPVRAASQPSSPYHSLLSQVPSWLVSTSRILWASIQTCSKKLTPAMLSDEKSSQVFSSFCSLFSHLARHLDASGHFITFDNPHHQRITLCDVNNSPCASWTFTDGCHAHAKQPETCWICLFLLREVFKCNLFCSCSLETQ